MITKPISLHGEDGAVLDGSTLTKQWTTGVKIKSGNVTWDNIDVRKFTQDGIIIGYEAKIPGNLQNVRVANSKISDIQPGYWGFGIYAGYEAEAFHYTPPRLTDFLDYSGLVIENNEVENTACSGIVLQSIKSPSGKLIVRNNYIHDILTNDAIWIDSARNILIEGNIIENNKWGIDIGAIGDDPDYSAPTLNGEHCPQDLTITCNFIISNAEGGVWINDAWPSTIFVNFNNISGNAYSDDVAYPIYGFQNNLKEFVDATKNWWGHASGPGGPDGRKNGKGDTIFGKVLWDHWLPQPIEHTPHSPVPPGLIKP